MARDPRAEYGAAKRRAAERGFPSVRGMRSANRLPRTAAELVGLPTEARWARSAAVAAAARSRDRRLPLEFTGGLEGVSVATIRFWLPGAVGPTRRGRTRTTPADRHLRLRPLAVEGEVTFVETHGSRAAGRAMSAFGVQWDFVHGQASEADLARLRGIRIGGRLVEADPDVLEHLARAGEFNLEERYRELLG
jgi:hypothetical protein